MLLKDYPLEVRLQKYAEPGLSLSQAQIVAFEVYIALRGVDAEEEKVKAELERRGLQQHLVEAYEKIHDWESQQEPGTDTRPPTTGEMTA